MGKMQSKFSQTIFLLLDQKSKQQQINEDLRQQISEQQEKIKLLKEVSGLGYYRDSVNRYRTGNTKI